MTQLPLELVIVIFSKATLKTLIQCRRVCKSWLAALSDEETLRSSIKLPKCLVLHVNSSAKSRSLYLYDHRNIPSPDNAVLKLAAETNDSMSVTTELVGFCNGMLCWCRRDDSDEAGLFRFTIYITNPLTGESMTIPAGTCWKSWSPIGFGFVSKKKQYKLVHLVPKGKRGKLEAKVQTIGSGTWNRIKCPYDIFDYSPAVYANGSIHWTWGKNIYLFDLETEQFGVLPSPPIASTRFMRGMVVIKDRVTVWASDRDRDRGEVWMMMEYGVESSWVELKARNFDSRLGRSSSDRELSYDGPLIFYPKKKSLILCRRYPYRDYENWGQHIYVHEHKRSNSFINLPFTKVKEALPGFVPTFLSIESLLKGAST